MPSLRYPYPFPVSRERRTDSGEWGPRARRLRSPALAAARAGAGSQMSRMKSRLTWRGWYLGGSIAVMTLFASLFGVEEFYALAAASGAVLFSAAVWLRRHDRLEIAAVTEVDVRRATSGFSASARLVLTSLGPKPVPPVTVDLPMRHRRTWEVDDDGEVEEPAAAAPWSCCLPGLGPRGRVGVTFKLSAARRGLWVIGPPLLTVSDPLGLTESFWCGGAENYLIVHPRVQALAVLPQLATATRPGVAAHHFPAHRGEELHTLREYRDGDDLRQVNWRATARWDRLVVREDEAARGCLVSIGLDLRANAHTHGSLERAVEAAASIACMVLAQPVGELRLTTTAGRRWRGSGKGARSNVLDALALASSHSEEPPVALFGAQAKVAVLVSATENSATQLLGRESTRALRSVVVVLVDELPSEDQPVVTVRHLGPPLGPVTLIRAGGGLAAAWSAAVGPEPFAQRAIAWQPNSARAHFTPPQFTGT
jgi:uncharacterized protein (DUF58 family)